AEFNSFSKELRNLNSEKLVLRLAELRNERIEFANRTYGIEKAIYHCIARKERILKIFETNYDLIDKNTIKNIKSSSAGIQFKDGKNEYAFNFSKSTLFKKFEVPVASINLPIEILKDPYELILSLFKKGVIEQSVLEVPGKDFIILPLYSLRESKKNKKVVAEKSGLNQWNAGGRKRDVGEVYIPIPTQIHKNFPNFLPSRDKSFNLFVPTGEILNAKICQENSKALMTNPNNALSDWLLRKVLKLKECQLLTYERLKLLGIDSVRLVKMDNNNFKIDFAKIDSYDNF
ncbi:MAG: restriction endonuclease, partial [Elusimicrobiota bacterium]|nr:restriction endonuclease [Elusimicrobiota bacterium]